MQDNDHFNERTKSDMPFAAPAPMITLRLKDYNIYIGDLRPVNEVVATGHYSRIVLLVDDNTRKHCLEQALQEIDFKADIITIPPGELHKSLDTCQYVWGEMMKYGLDRQSLMINLGGGVIGDLGGFCASTFLRGIDFIQVPTTLLSQVDASVGGKLGVDFQLYKNSIGVFRNPIAVFINPAFLETLPQQEIRSGFAEIYKHALIADDGLWEDLKRIKELSTVEWSKWLARSLSVKKSVVEADPQEAGVRKILNFGHTVGHAVESFSMDTRNPLLHGEAIAVGMICESWLSYRVAGLTPDALEEITAFTHRFYDKFPYAERNFKDILSYMVKDKKNTNGRINFTLLPEIGKAQYDHYCDPALIKESLLYYQESYNS